MRSEHCANIRSIWADLLNIPASGITDSADFFALGGTSYLAARLIGGVHAKTGVVLSIQSIFEHPTPAGLAACVDRQSSTAKDPVTNVRQIPAPAAWVLSSNQEYRIRRQQRWSAENLDAGGRNIDVAFIVTGPFDLDRFEESIRRLIHAADGLRTVFAENEDTFSQSVHPTCEFTLERHKESDELAALAAASHFCRQWFPAEAKVRLKAAAWRLGIDRHLIALTFDHLVCDAYAVRRMLADIATGYTTPAAAGPADPGFAGYVEAERSRLGDGGLARAVSNWRTWAIAHQIGADSYPPPLELRVHAPGGPALAAARYAITARRDELQPAVEAARQAGTTLNLTVLAALGRALASRTDRQAIVAMSHVDNRDEIGQQDIMGWVSNRIPVIIDARGCETFAELLPRVRDSFRKALAWKNIPGYAMACHLHPAAHGQPSWPIVSYNSAISLDEETSLAFGDAAVEEVSVDIPGPIGEPGIQITTQLRQGDLQISFRYEIARYPRKMFEQIEREVITDLITSSARHLATV